MENPVEKTITSGPLFDALQEAIEPDEVDSAFILSDGVIKNASDVLGGVNHKASIDLYSSFSSIDPDSLPNKVLIAKSISGSKVSEEELTRGCGGLSSYNIDGDIKNLVISPPYSPTLLSEFFEGQETNSRCIITKTTDSVGRGFQILPTVPIVEEDSDSDIKVDITIDSPENCFFPKGSITQKEFDVDQDALQVFLEDCNDIDGFEGTLELAAMDYEAIGWGAIEVIRSRDMKVARINHVPASTIEALKGWRGFVEDRTNGAEDYRYYQPFGHKVVVSEEDPITGINEKIPYDPKKHGTLEASNDKLSWNLKDCDTGEDTEDFAKAATEIIWIRNRHSNTKYYGYSDVVPALGAVLGNMQIRKYFLNFFSHSAVPRYAIIVEGGKLSQPVMKSIAEYFNSEVKQNHYATLIVNVPSVRGEVKLRFERLDAGQKEGDFLKTEASNDQSIMVAHGVSAAIIGITEASELGSGKGLSQAEIYKDRIIVPRQKIWARVVNHIIRYGLGLCLVKLEFNPLDIRDEEARMRIATQYSDRGATTINEMRKEQGKEPMTGGDRLFIKTRAGEIIFVDAFADLAGDLGRVVPAVSAEISDGKKGKSQENSDSGQDT